LSISGTDHSHTYQRFSLLGLLATLVKTVLRFVPIVVMAPMATTAISAAIRPYSIAVAPDSSSRSERKGVHGVLQFDSLTVVAFSRPLMLSISGTDMTIHTKRCSELIRRRAI